MEQVQASHFDENHLNLLHRQLAANDLAKQAKIFKKERHEINGALQGWFGLIQKSKLKWEIEPFSDFNSLRAALRDSSIAHLVIILHGTNISKIVDAENNLLPAEGFSDISPYLQSINFFACHGEEALAQYPIAETFLNQVSPLPVRFTSFIQNKGFLQSSSEALLAALTPFMTSVDQKAYDVNKKSARLRTLFAKSLPAMPPPPKVCIAQIESSSIENGSFSVTLNHHWLGQLVSDKPSSHADFEFDCSWLKKFNRLDIEDNTIFGNAVYPRTDPVLILHTLEGRSSPIYTGAPESENVFYRTDMSIGGLSWIFTAL